MTAAWEKRLADPPYLFTDMAADCAGLLDALGIESAHVVGASLGGFISQTLAFERPERVRSLASVMSSTGSGRSVAAPEALEVLMTAPPQDSAVRREHRRRQARDRIDGIRAGRVVGARIARRAFERGLNPAGTQRQLVASICSGDRTPRLRRSWRRPSSSTARRTR